MCICEIGSNRVEHETVEQKAEILQDWVSGLLRRFQGGKIAIALEQSKGALIFLANIPKKSRLSRRMIRKSRHTSEGEIYLQKGA